MYNITIYNSDKITVLKRERWDDPSLVGRIIQGQTGSYFSAGGHFDLKRLKRDYVY